MANAGLDLSGSETGKRGESVYSSRMDYFEGHGSRSGTDDQSQYTAVYRKFGRLLNDPTIGVSLADIALSCANRKASNDEDCARAFFPTLGLQWKSAYDRAQGMIEIIQARPDHAARIAG